MVIKLGINEALEVKENRGWWCFLFPPSPSPHSVREEGLVRDGNLVTESVRRSAGIRRCRPGALTREKEKAVSGRGIGQGPRGPGRKPCQSESRAQTLAIR